MEFLKNIEWTPINILKGLGVLLLFLVVLSFASHLFGPTGLNLMQKGGGYSIIAPGMPSSMPAYERGMMYDTDDAYDYVEEAAYDGGYNTKLSLTNIGVPEPQPDSVGGDAEDYEVKSYSASVETQDSDWACGEILALKSLDYVVFENSNEYERGCTYTFKVENEKVDEVLAVIERLDPKDMSESAYTIKRQIDDFTSETEILERKLAVVDETLEKAVAAYDEITDLATQTRNAESLAEVIDSKINTIERLTQQRINISSQLERLSRSKAEQMDRLVYAHFNVNVYENKFIDGETIKDSWKGAVKGFVRDVNQTAQDLTINLISFLFMLVQYILYFFILLFIVKYGWQTALHIWKK